MASQKKITKSLGKFAKAHAKKNLVPASKKTALDLAPSNVNTPGTVADGDILRSVPRAKKIKASDYSEPEPGEVTPSQKTIEGMMTGDLSHAKETEQFEREQNRIALDVIERSTNPNRVDPNLGHSPAMVAQRAGQPMMTLSDLAAIGMSTRRR